MADLTEEDRARLQAIADGGAPAGGAPGGAPPMPTPPPPAAALPPPGGLPQAAPPGGERGWVGDLTDWYHSWADKAPKDPLMGKLASKLGLEDGKAPGDPDPSSLSEADRHALAAYHAEKDPQPAQLQPPAAPGGYDPAAVEAAARARMAPPLEQAPPNPAELAAIGIGGPSGAGAGKGLEDFDPETTKALKKYAELTEGAAESGAEGKETEHEAAKQAAADEAQFRTGQRGMEEGERLERKARLDEAEGHWKSAMEDAGKAKLEDPRSHLNWGQKLAMAISMAAGAFGAGLTHSENGVAKMWSDYLNEDIDRQKAELAAKKGNVEEAHGVYADLLRRTGDEEKAATLARAHGLEAFRSGLQEQLLTAQDPTARAAGMRELADAQKAIIEERDKYDKIAAAKRKAAGAGGGGLSTKELENRIKDMRDKAAANGIDFDPVEARRQAIYESTGKDPLPGRPLKSYAKPPKEGAELAGGEKGLEDTAEAMPGNSTNWEPQRYLQGTEAHAHLQQQEQYNAGLISRVPGKGMAVKQAQAAPFLIKPDDSPATILAKVQGAQRAGLLHNNASGSAAIPGFQPAGQ